MISSSFTSNTAKTNGGAIYWNVVGYIAYCSFVNSKSDKVNGIYARQNLNIDGGNGIVYVYINSVLSGISIVVLNNETYYYPPNTNINFTK